MTFAVGRLLNQASDTTLISALSVKAKAANGSFTSIIRSALLSEGFRSWQAQVGP